VLGVAFHPARQHELERQRVEAQWREVEEQGAPPRSRVDLDSGVARLRIPAPGDNRSGGAANSAEIC
jgi:hypothetical protein